MDKSPLFVDPDIRRARTLPKAFYTEDRFWDLTRERLFARSWQWVSARGASPGPGFCYPFELLPGFLDEPLVLSQDEFGKLHLLSNVCTHRANLVVPKAGQYQKLRCPYHGRRFSLDGSFEFMPGFEGCENFPGPQDDLPSLPVARFGRFLFTSLDPLMSFADWIKPVKERMGWLPWDQFSLDSTRSREYAVEAHWALYIDNYLEGFHIPFVHPDLNQALDFSNYRHELFDWGTLQIGVVKPGELAFELPADHPDAGQQIGAYYFWLFPNLMLNFYPWGLSLNHIQPVSPTHTRISFLSYVWKPQFLPLGAGSDLDKVEREDEAVVEWVGKGVRSRLYREGRYSPEHEQGVHHFHRLLGQVLG